MTTQQQLHERMTACETRGADAETWGDLADDWQEEMRGLVGGARRAELRTLVGTCRHRAVQAAIAALKAVR